MEAMNFPHFQYPEVRRDESCIDNPNKVSKYAEKFSLIKPILLADLTL